MKYTNKCSCKWCTVTSPLCTKIQNLLTDPVDKNNFINMMNDLIMAETDVVYWKDKYYGTWPSDTVRDIEQHITILQNRIQELRAIERLEKK